MTEASGTEFDYRASEPGREIVLKSNTRESLFLLPVLVIAAVAAWSLSACENEPDIPVPDGWKRIEVRQGLFTTDPALANVNFAANMPEEWEAFDIFVWWDPSQVRTPVGAMEGSSGNEPLYYEIKDGAATIPDRYLDEGRFSLQIETIEGVEVTLWQTATHFQRPAPVEAGAFFPSIPGDAASDASLILWGQRLDESDVPTVHDIARSVRAAKVPSPPNDPEIMIIPGNGWKTLQVTSAFGPAVPFMEITTPPGWTAESSAGYDSTGVTITNGSISIFMDVGGNAGCDRHPGDHIRLNSDLPELRFWDEQIDGSIFYFYRPLGDDRDYRGRIGATGACVPVVPPRGTGDWPSLGLGADAHVESEHDQELVLAILRTLMAVR